MLGTNQAVYAEAAMKCTLDDPNLRLWPLVRDPFTIDWKKDGDEWLDHLMEEFRLLGATTQGAAGPHTTPAFPTMHLEYKLEGVPQISSTIVFILGRESLGAYLSNPEEPSNDEVELWLGVIDRSFLRLGHSDRRLAWKAAIAPDPRGINRDVVFAEPFSVGGITVAPGRVRLDEWITNTQTPPSFHSGGRSATWPAVVGGEAHGYSWNIGSKLASRDLHRLCVLLTVLSDACWIIRDGPHHREDGEWELTIPTHIFWQEEDPTAQFGDPRTVQTPDWIDEAWSRLHTDERLDAACSMYHEGRLLEQDHPSYANLAFSGVAEQAAILLGLPEKDSNARIKAALGLVEPPPVVEQLTGRERSQTAHGYKLHGHELTRSAFVMPGPFSLPEDMLFRFAVLWRLNQAVRKLLLLAFTQSGGGRAEDIG